LGRKIIRRKLGAERKIQCTLMLAESDIVYLDKQINVLKERSRSAVMRKLIRDDKKRS